MNTAYVIFRRHHSYPTAHVIAGIKVCGDQVRTFDSTHIDEDSIAVTWNCYGTARRISDRVKQLGGRHIVFENGYMRRDRKYYAAGIDGINGNESNLIPDVTDERFKELDLKIEPWKENGKYILVCAQRGGGYNPMAMPNSWPEEVIDNIITYTDMQIKYRPHPERQVELDSYYSRRWGVVTLDPNEPLEEHLEDAYAAVVYTSNVANEALLQGVPVFYGGPTIACAHLALPGVGGISKIRSPFYPNNREQYFNYLAHRQFNIEEIRTGKLWQNLVH